LKKNRGRIEVRTCYKAPDLRWFEDLDQWKGLKTAFAIHRKTTTKTGVYEEINYYISSKDESPKRFLEIVREYWRIESMHWQLDVVFSEDDCRILNSNGQKSMNIFRKFALAIHKKYVNLLPQKTKPSLKKNMLKSLLSDEHLLAVLKCGL